VSWKRPSDEVNASGPLTDTDIQDYGITHRISETPILTKALDRLSRDQADDATIYKRLSFHGVRIISLSDCEISELHVGLKGTMYQLFLKDLAAKTRRGRRGRVEAGRSGGVSSYG
jgi:site-specific DNA recombinase